MIVHQAVDLPGSDLPDPPDPYVKMYLLPERKSKSKRKTEVVKDSTTPTYDEKFDYDIPVSKIGLTQLEVRPRSRSIYSELLINTLEVNKL